MSLEASAGDNTAATADPPIEAGSASLPPAWTQDQWTEEAIRDETVQTSITQLLKSREEFECVAAPKDLTELQHFQQEFRRALASVTSQQESNGTTTGSGILPKLKQTYNEFADIAFRLSKHLNAISTAAPAYVQAACCIVHIILLAQVNGQKTKEYMQHTLCDISSDFETLDVLASYAPTSPMIAALSEVYASFLDFLKEAIIFHTEPRLKRTVKAVTKPVESRLQPIVDKMRRAKQRLIERGQVATLGATVRSIQTVQDLQEKLERLGASVTFGIGELSGRTKHMEQLLQQMWSERAETMADFSQPKFSPDQNSPGVNGEDTAGPDTSSIDALCSIISSRPRASHTIEPHHEHAATQYHNTEGTVDAELQSVLAWLENDDSSILWLRAQTSYEALFWNINLVEPAIADFLTSRPRSASLKCFCGQISNDQRLRTPTAVLQLLIVQLLDQYRYKLQAIDTLSEGKRLPSEQEFIASKTSFCLTIDIFDKCLQLCRPDFLLIIIGGMDELYPSESPMSRGSEASGSYAELIDCFEALLNKSWLLSKFLLTANEDRETAPATKLQGYRDLPRDGSDAKSLIPLARGHPRLYVNLFAATQRSVAFPDLLLLYRPNAIVYHRSQETWQAYLVVDISQDVSTYAGARKTRPLTLRCWRTLYFAGKLRRVIEHLEIQSYTGVRLIESLDFVPAAFLPGESDVRTTLMQRGQRYCSYTKGFHYLELSGSYAQMYSIDGVCRVVVDLATHDEEMERDGSHKQLSDTFIDSLHEHAAAVDMFKPIVYITCPRHILGYDLARNTWFDAEVDKLSQIPECGRGIFSDLNLDHNTMETLADTAEAYIDARKVFKSVSFTESEYMTRNVGILTLLHGPPASGMTYTVEALAEVYSRPLVRVSGNLVTEGSRSHQQLRRIFEYARLWNAFIIAKDVDIFFQTYSGRDVSQAALGSLVRELIRSHTGLLYIVTHGVTEFDASHFSLFAVTVAFEAWTPDRRYNALIGLLKQVGFDDTAEDWLEVDTWLKEELSLDESLDIRKMKNFIAVATIRAKAGGGPIRRYELKHAARMTSNFGRLMINQRLQQSRSLK